MSTSHGEVLRLIHHMIGCMVRHIKKEPSIIGMIVVGFAKYTSCYGLIFVDKWHITKTEKNYTP